MMSPLPSSSLRRFALLVMTVLFLCGVPLAAHDMWIEPTSFLPEIGQVVSVRFRVGQDLLGDPMPLDPSLVSQFVARDAAGVRPIVGRDGRDPAGLVRVATPGLLAIGYRSHPSAIEMAAEKFNQYLSEEGLDAVAALRAARKETGAAAHEIFSRCAKSLLFSGTPGDAQNDRPLGFTLELVSERNPYAATAERDLPFRLIYENRPLAGALVVAVNRAKPTEKVSTRILKSRATRKCPSS